MKTQNRVKLVDKNKSVSGSIVEEKQDRQILPSHVKGFTDIFYSNTTLLSLIKKKRNTTGSSVVITPGEEGMLPPDWAQYSFSKGERERQQSRMSFVTTR